MIEDSSTALPTAGRPLTLSALPRVALTAFCSITPIFAVVLLFVDMSHGNSAGVDFRQFYSAAEAILHGVSPYSPTVATPWAGPYPYPPLPALVAVPLTVLPVQAAALLTMAVLVVVALAVPYVLGVRDWRCYGVMLLWPPVLNAIQTGNVTLWFALALAITWRLRDRVFPVSAAIGFTLAVKFFLWPLVIWFAATRRYLAATASLVLGVLLVVVSWAVVGFAGFVDYPSVLRKLEETVGPDSYTTYILGVQLGLPSPVSRAIWLALGLSLVAGVVVLGHRGDERRAFILGIAASLALTPIVWMHYFALLVVVVSLAQRRLGLIWFIPLATAVTNGSGHHTAFQISAALLAAAVTVALALERAGDEQPRPSVVRAEGVAA